MMIFSNEEKDRYSRHFLLEDFGEAAQQKLKSSRVLVVGAGGLGCPALLYLAAAGVGYIGIVDHDVLALSNLQRQVLYTMEDIGAQKAFAAEKRLSSLNPHVNFCSLPENINTTNALKMVGEYDIIIDCTDNFATRYLLNDACVIMGKPLVYGAIFKFEGQVSVFNLGSGPTYRCLFPDAAEEEASCSEVGVLGVLPGIVGAWQAAEAIKLITGIGEPLSGQLLTFDLRRNSFNNFRIQTISSNKTIKELGAYNNICAVPVNEIDAETLQHWLREKVVQLIDVREYEEYQAHNIGGINIPLSSLKTNLKIIETSQLTVVCCQSGNRSIKAIEIIQSHFPEMRIYNLKKGLQGLLH